MTRPPARFVIGFVVLAVVAVAVIVILSQPPPAPPPLPKPNGYDDFVKASQMLSGDISDWPKMSKEELQTVLTNDAEALKVVRIGLSRECRVPLDYSPIDSARLQLRNLTELKPLAQTLSAEGRLAELEDRPGDAAKSYLDVIRLGHQSARGGLEINSLVGIAIEAIGLSSLEKLVPRLDATQSREVASALEDCESRREPWESVLAQEHDWGRRTFGFKGQITRLVMFKTFRWNEQKLAGKVKARQLQTEQVVIELASRAYELEKGQRPQSLAELVPAYLKAIPRDPFTGTNMAYRP